MFSVADPDPDGSAFKKSSWIRMDRCSVSDPDPWNPYHFPGSGSGSVSKNGWIRNPDPDPTKTIENIK